MGPWGPLGSLGFLGPLGSPGPSGLPYPPRCETLESFQSPLWSMTVCYTGPLGCFPDCLLACGLHIAFVNAMVAHCPTARQAETQ